jgi:hypothetical protein
MSVFMNNISFEEYLKIDAINASFLKACAGGAYEGYQYKTKTKAVSDAMEFGTAVHTALLEPEVFKASYAFSEKFDRRTKIGKAAAEEFESANQGKKILDADDLQRVQTIVKNCREIKQIRDALETFEKEKSYVWEEDIGGVPKKFKARLDLVDENSGVIIDVKTTRNANPKAFIRDLIEMKYDLQFFQYAKALKKIPTCFVIAIESDSLQVAMYDITDIVTSTWTQSRYELAVATALEVETLEYCPPKYSTNIVNLMLPNWATSEAV